jgi:MATE family multidrug resistance protein
MEKIRLVRPEILALAWPSALSLFLNNFYGLNDQFWVKALGPESQAAVADAGMITILAFALYEGLGTGILALSARAQGGGDQGRAHRIFKLGIRLSLFLALAVALLGFGFLDQWIAWILPQVGDSPSPSLLLERTELARYISPILGGGLVLCLAVVFDNCFLAMKDSKTPLYLQSVAVLLNTALNPLLIFGLGPIPPMGVLGAALASILSRVLTVVLGFLILRKRFGNSNHQSFDKEGNLTRIRKILKIGTPATGAIALYSLAYLVMLNLVFPPFGAVGRAAFGAGFRLEGLGFCLIWGLGIACGALVGRTLGGGKPDRAEQVVKESVRLVLYLCIPITLLFLLLPGPLAGVLGANPEVAKEIVVYLRIIALSQFAAGLQGVLEQAILGAGHSFPVFLSTTVWNLARIPIAMLLAPHFGLPGIWWAVNITTYGKATTALWIFGKGGWKKLDL